MRKLLIATAVACVAFPLAAQAPDSAAIKLKARVDAIFGVPQRAEEARQAGVADSTISRIMKIFGSEKIGAEDAVVILTAERDAARMEGGKGAKDNFGAFVQRQHAAGLRGQDLAAAIHAEQARRGMGKKGGRMEEMMERGKKPEEMWEKGKKPEEAKGKGKKPNDTESAAGRLFI